jgi:hypothetical protein
MLGRVQFRFEKMVNVGKIIENRNGPIISNRGSSPFFKNRHNDCLLPQFRESVLR